MAKISQDEHMDPSVTETYMGEWKNDKRSGFGISERSDGLKYEGEWYGNKKYGYGVTTFNNGEKEEGKYKNNVLITSQKKKLFLMRSAKFRERIDAAVNAAQRASKIALQKADIAITRTATARGKAEQADIAAAQAKDDSDIATTVARQYAPDFKQPGLEKLRNRQKYQANNTEVKIDQKDNLNPTSNEIGNTVPNQELNQIQSQNSSNLSQISSQINNKPLTNQISHVPNHIQNKDHNQSFYGKKPDNYSVGNPSQNNPASSSIYNNPNSSIAPPSEFGPQVAFTIEDKLSKELPNLNKPRHSLPSEDNHPAMNAIRRQSRRVSGDRPYLANVGQQSSIDHFDHYKRPPSREASVDRYQRATGRLSGTGSRQVSVEKTSRPSETPDRTVRAPSAVRGTTPAPNPPNPSSKNGTVLTGSAAKLAGNNPTQPPPFEEIIIRKRGLGQDIIPSPNQPKRTESLFIPGAAPAPPVTKVSMRDTKIRFCSRSVA